MKKLPWHRGSFAYDDLLSSSVDASMTCGLSRRAIPAAKFLSGRLSSLRWMAWSLLLVALPVLNRQE